MGFEFTQTQCKDCGDIRGHQSLEAADRWFFGVHRFECPFASAGWLQFAAARQGMTE